MTYEPPSGLALPEGWQTVRLEQVATKIRSGATPTGGSGSYLPYRSKYVLIRSQNVLDHDFDDAGLANISEDQARDLGGAEVEEGDVLLNITGDGVTFGRSCIVPQRVLPACVNQHVMLIRLDMTKCLPEYLLAWLTLPETKQYIESFNAGGSRRAITKGHIQSFILPLPPLAEQRSIAGLVSTINARIQLAKDTCSALGVIAQTLFRSWFFDFDPVRAKSEGREPDGMDSDTARLFPSVFEESELGSIPKGWQVGTVADLLILQRGFDLPAAERVTGSFPILAASGPSGTHNKAMVNGPGVTTGRSGVLGRVYFVQEDFWPLNTSLWVKEFRRATPIYAYQFLRTLDLVQLNAGSAVPTLNRNHVHSRKTVVPPKPLVDAYEAVAATLLRRIKLNEDQSNSLATIRDTLLPRLISGKLRIPEAQAVVQEALA